MVSWYCTLGKGAPNVLRLTIHREVESEDLVILRLAVNALLDTVHLILQTVTHCHQ